MRKLLFWTFVILGVLISCHCMKELLSSWQIPFAGTLEESASFAAVIYVLSMAAFVVYLYPRLDDNDDIDPVDIILIITFLVLIFYVGYFGIMNWIWPNESDRTFWPIAKTVVLDAVYGVVLIRSILIFINPCSVCSKDDCHSCAYWQEYQRAQRE